MGSSIGVTGQQFVDEVQWEYLGVFLGNPWMAKIERNEEGEFFLAGMGIQLQIHHFLRVSSLRNLLKDELYSTNPLLLFLGTEVKLDLPAAWYWVLLKGKLERGFSSSISLWLGGIFLKEAKDETQLQKLIFHFLDRLFSAKLL